MLIIISIYRMVITAVAVADGRIFELRKRLDRGADDRAPCGEATSPARSSMAVPIIKPTPGILPPRTSTT